MMTLIALAISVAFVFSAAVTLGYPGHAALGGAGDARHDHAPRSLARDALDLAGAGRGRRAGEAPPQYRDSHRTGHRRSRTERTEDVPIGELREGDLVLVRPGASIPADGVVRAGTSAVNESMITGESRPVEKKAGDNVIAGTTNGSGSLASR